MTSHQWGRVDDDGTVYVKTADGERSVGHYPEGSREEALATLDRARALPQLHEVPHQVLFSTRCFRQRGALIADAPTPRKGRAA